MAPRQVRIPGSETVPCVQRLGFQGCGEFSKQGYHGDGLDISWGVLNTRYLGDHLDMWGLDSVSVSLFEGNSPRCNLHSAPCLLQMSHSPNSIRGVIYGVISETIKGLLRTILGV